MAQVWVDTDAGFDDLLAIQMMAHSAQFSVAGISLVAGNSRLSQVVDNARRMAATFNWEFSIHAGAERPLSVELQTAEYVLGPRGMHTRSRWFDEPARALECTDAQQAIIDWLELLEQPAPILALGPLTNIANLLNARADLKNRISELVLMGGSTDRGNSTAVAEFNIYTDPEAAACVFQSGLPLKMVGINVCRQVQAVADDIVRFETADGAQNQLLADLMAGYLSIRDKSYKEPMPLFDPVAAAALLAPQFVTWQQAHVAIELKGEFTRGMTVCEFRVPQKAEANCLVAMKAEEKPIKAMMFEAFGITLSDD